MDPSDAIQLILIFILLLLSAFFTSAETAIATINKVWNSSAIDSDNEHAALLLKITQTPDKLLCAILIGNTLVDTAIIVLGTLFTIKHFSNLALVIAVAILVLLVLIFGKIIPHTLATINAEKTALACARLLYFLMIVFTPLIFIILKLGSAILRLFGLDLLKRTPAMTEDELRTLVDASHEDGVIEQEEKQIIHNVFDFSDSQAKDIMIPRIDMTFINIDTTYDELMAIHNESAYTRYPVYEEAKDAVIGTINIKDLLFYENRGDFSITPLLREPYFTYEQKNSSALFTEMRDQSINFAIVLDEYGATAGLITMEDMLEEIVGDIRDEYDEEEAKVITTITDGREYTVLGAAKLDDINEELQLDIHSKEYDSIGGYILEQLDRIPDENEEIFIDDETRLVIDKLSNNRIEIVHVYLPKRTTADDTEKEAT